MKSMRKCNQKSFEMHLNRSLIVSLGSVRPDLERNDFQFFFVLCSFVVRMPWLM